jgi:NAD-dependent dihydropyrimidine dehydrogenase PreA subunit
MGKKIIFCNCSGERIDSERLQVIEKNIRKVNSEIVKVSDLCALIALRKDILSDVFRKENKYLIIGCYDRSMRLLLEQSDIDHKNISFDFINFFELTNEEIFQRVSSFCENSNQTSSIKEIDRKSDWISWFPVIDYSRCSGCGQCADFCLFGVYEKSEGRVNVINPVECKNNCPACARICPQTAIIFPKYKYGGAIGGSEFIDESEEQKRQSIDIKNILEGDIYSSLEKRKNKRQSIIRNEAMNKAIGERDEALSNT